MAGIEAMVDSPMVVVQYGLALAVPAVLAAIMNIGCGKKRDQAPRPGQKTLSKPGGASSKSKRASKSSSASAKSGKSSKKIKSGKSKKSASKDSKSSKSSKKSKRELKSKAVAAGGASQRSDAAKQPSSGAGRTAAEAEKRKLATTAAAITNDNSAKSAPTQVASASMKQPPSGGALDANANVAAGAGGTTALVAIGGDSTQQLKMEPAELRWSSAGGMQKISLINQSAERQAVKVKCSDNNVYRVNPVYAIVEPGQTLNVDVMRQNGSNKVDKIVFVTARAGIEENPKNAFKSGAPSSMMVLPLLATSTAAAYNQQALVV